MTDSDQHAYLSNAAARAIDVLAIRIGAPDGRPVFAHIMALHADSIALYPAGTIGGENVCVTEWREVVVVEGELPPDYDYETHIFTKAEFVELVEYYGKE